jgi:Uncharacterized conserved protein (some members contain a von Willebrand factor type A (vWA) domain)
MLKNLFKYLLLLVAVGALAILYNVYYTGIVFLTLCILPFVLFGVMCYCYGKITAQIVSAVHIANKGDKIPISIQLNNPTIFPISYLKVYLNYQNAYSSKKFKKVVTIPIDNNTNTTVILTLISECAGNLLVTLEGIRIYDYFKLFSLKKKQQKELKVAILPNYYELAECTILKNAQFVESDSYHPTKKGDDPSEVFEIREYREGDRLQRIHWKLSKKVDQLMIKELSEPLNSSVLLFVNLCIPDGEHKLYYMDAILECALSLSYSFLMQQQAHYICWSDENNGCCSRIRVTQEEDLYDAVDGLLHAMPYQNASDMVAAYLSQYPHEHYSDAFFITGEISTSWLHSIAALKTHSRQMIYITDKQKDKSLEVGDQEAVHQMEDMGMEMWSVELGNIKTNLELLSIS